MNIWECRVPRASGDKPAELLNKAACAAVFPRASGDKPGQVTACLVLVTCSPRQRG
ncbi:hypothetical protein SEEM030_18973 [Salmonella enterica subsp. enterica serovar Montevideo str. SARB30]|nr:hypothetical protein SEEM030_18973 [Salmonella enterica subsp. enterica serovar Montevideo str. SARB30]